MHRLAEAKQGGKGYERKEVYTNSIRKAQTDEFLEKRRKEIAESDTPNLSEDALIKKLLWSKESLKQYIPSLCERLTSETDSEEPIRLTRKLTAYISQHPEISGYFISYNVHFAIANLLKSNNPTILNEAVWSVTNLLSGCMQTSVSVLSTGLLTDLKRIIKDPNSSVTVLDSAVWALCNASADNLVPLEDVKEFLNEIPRLRGLEKEELNNNICWFLNNIALRCSLELYERVSGIILELILTKPNSKCLFFLLHACLRLMNRSCPAAPGSASSPSLSPPFIFAMENVNIYSALADDSAFFNSDLSSKTFSAFANFCGVISRHPDEHLTRFSESGLMVILRKCTDSHVPETRRKATWAFSNFAACRDVNVVRNVYAGCDLFRSMRPHSHHPLLDVVHVYANAAITVRDVVELSHYGFLEGWRAAAEKVISSQAKEEISQVLMRAILSFVNNAIQNPEVLSHAAQVLGETLMNLHDLFALDSDEEDGRGGGLEVGMVNSRKVENSTVKKQLKANLLSVLTEVQVALGLKEEEGFYGDDVEDFEDFEFSDQEGGL
eukprot:GDKJ01057492.1.p1 GENE.GDKJ01057492.1~~GDKJ01057492.1.p1  ORF type:complete len:553 (-),score=131.29 GDKJ01057492.1:59-1717(-)